MKHIKMNKSLTKLNAPIEKSKYDLKYEEINAGMIALLGLNDPKRKFE